MNTCGDGELWGEWVKVVSSSGGVGIMGVMGAW